MKKINLNLGQWFLSTVGIIAVALSIIISIPGISQAFDGDSATADCGNGISITCTGTDCGAQSGIGCQCSGKPFAYCPGKGGGDMPDLGGDH